MYQKTLWFAISWAWLIFLAAVWTPIAASIPTPTISPSSAPVQPTPPISFQVTPRQAEPGQPITVRVENLPADVTSGQAAACVELQDPDEQTADSWPLEPGKPNVTGEFTLGRYVTPGQYQLVVTICGWFADHPIPAEPLATLPFTVTPRSGRFDDIKSQLSPNGQWTATVNRTTGSLELNGRGQSHLVFPDRSGVSEVAWSSDSSRLLVVQPYAAIDPQQGTAIFQPIEIWQVRLENRQITSPTLLFRSSEEAFERDGAQQAVFGHWSPDNRYVIMWVGILSASILADGLPPQVLDTETGQAYPVALDSSVSVDPQDLSRDNTALINPRYQSWSPDSTKLAITAGGYRSAQINKWLNLFDVTTGQVTTVISQTRQIPGTLAWSPRGDLIAYAAVPAEQTGKEWADLMTFDNPAIAGRRIYLLDPATGQYRRLNSVESYQDAPVWSPDGLRLYYVQRNGEILDLMVADPATGQARPVPGASQPVDLNDPLRPTVGYYGQFGRGELLEQIPEALTGTIEWVGQIGGPDLAVAVQGNYAYVGIGPRLAVLDVTDPAHPQLVGQSNPLPAVVRQIEFVAPYAYVVAGAANNPGGLFVFDVTDVTRPTQVGVYAQAGFSEFSHFMIAGNYAYLPGETDLQIIDLSDPTRPTKAGQYSTSDPIFGIALVGEYAFLTTESQLHVIDVSTPANPIEISTYSITTGSAREIVIHNNLAYVTVIESDVKPVPRFLILDVSDPPRPTEVMTSESGGHILALTDRYAYVGVYITTGSMAIMDLSDPANITQVSAYGDLVAPADVAVSGHYAYVAYGGRGLHILDMSDSAQPTLVTRFDTLSFSASSLAVQGDYVYVADQTLGSRLRVVDVTDPAQPAVIGLTNELPPFAQMAVADDYLYLLSSDLHILDVSTPAKPAEVGLYSHEIPTEEPVTTAILDIAIAAPYVYLAEDTCQLDAAGLPTTCTGDLRVLDVSNPSSPTEVGFAALAEARAEAVVVVDSYAYVTTEAGRLHILDVSQPAKPVELSVSEIAPKESRFSLSLVAHYVYVFTDDRLLILDVTDPTRPVEAGALTPVCGNNVPRRLSRIGNRAYVVDGFFEAELCIIDLSDPTKPVELGFYRLPGNAIRDMLAVGNLLYVANDDGGLWILQVKNN